MYEKGLIDAEKGDLFPFSIWAGFDQLKILEKIKKINRIK
jgi:hypothetical protein